MGAELQARCESVQAALLPPTILMAEEVAVADALAALAFVQSSASASASVVMYEATGSSASVVIQYEPRVKRSASVVMYEVALVITPHPDHDPDTGVGCSWVLPNSVLAVRRAEQ